MSKAKKSFKKEIKDDCKPVAFAEENEVPSKARTKAVPGARLIPITDIIPDPDQPRKKFDQEKLNDLADSINSKGIIEPITVRLIEDETSYMIVTGERRYRAAQIAGLTEVPCIIKDLSDQEALIHQLIENIQREDLSPIDEATALKKLLDNGLTQAEVAKKVGKSQPYISQALRILELPQNILKQAQETEVTKEHLLQLLKSENPEQLWEQAKTGSTAKEIKQAVKKEKPSKGRPKTKPWTWKPKDKSFTVSIKFKKSEYDKEQVIQALEELIQELRKKFFNSRKSSQVP